MCIILKKKVLFFFSSATGQRDCWGGFTTLSRDQNFTFTLSRLLISRPAINIKKSQWNTPKMCSARLKYLKVNSCHNESQIKMCLNWPICDDAHSKCDQQLKNVFPRYTLSCLNEKPQCDLQILRVVYEKCLRIRECVNRSAQFSQMRENSIIEKTSLASCRSSKVRWEFEWRTNIITRRRKEKSSLFGNSL